MKFLQALVLSVLVAACGKPVIKPTPPMLHDIPAGSIVQLNLPLTVPAEHVDAGIQFGKPTAAIEQGEPHCRFEVNTLSDRDTTIPAGDYHVTRVLRFSDPFYSSNGTLKTAAADTGTAWLAMGGGSPDTIWYYRTVFYLDSATFPNIRQLTCGEVFPSGFEARDITLADFENAVGDVVKIVKP
jgi:hypothetical protein